MPKTQLTIEVDAMLLAWIEELAQASGATAAQTVVTLIKEEQARRAMESVAAWARNDADAPSIEEVDAARAMMLGEDEEKR